MEITTTDDIFASNAAIRKEFKAVVESLTYDQLNSLSGDEKWTVSQIVEHVLLVNESAYKICRRLLSKAEAAGQTGDGSANLSPVLLGVDLRIPTLKFDAPDTVKPDSMKVEESIRLLNENSEWMDSLRDHFRTLDGITPKFPHPYFGDLSAQDWLYLAGEHEHRHIGQINRLLESLG